MRRILTLILTLLALCLPLCGALAELTDEQIAALAISKAQTELQDMKEGADGWVRVMLDDAKITGTEMRSGSIYVLVSVPELGSAVKSAVTPDADPAGYLDAAFANYLNHEVRSELKLNMTWSEEDGTVTTKWSGVSGPRSLLSTLKGMAGKAKKTYTYKNMKAALDAYLFPKCAEMPKKLPDAFPQTVSIADWALEVGRGMDLTAEQAQGRFRCLLLMTELSKVDSTEPLEQAVLTLKVDDWQAMLNSALTGAEGLLDQVMGAPELTRDEAERYLWQAMPDACLPLLYDKKGVTETKVTMDLAAAVGADRGQCAGLTNWLATYNTAFENTLSALMNYASRLPYYPKVAPINAGVLTGEESTSGAYVAFDSGAEEGAWLCVRHNGQTVLTGYARAQVRLMVRLAAGDYEVLYTRGAEWYGESYRFGKEAHFGSFALTVPAEGTLRVDVSGADGGAGEETLTEEAFEAALKQKTRQ